MTAPKLPKPKESQIEHLILDYLTFQCRHFAWKNPSAGYFDEALQRFRPHASPYAINGTPDIYCQLKGIPHLKGVVVHFEVKRKGETQTLDQLKFELRIKECDGYYFVVRSLADVEAALRSLNTSS